MKILVTGGSGTIGSNLKEVISDKHIWFFPTSKEMNLLDERSIELYFMKNKPDFIVHLAANVGGLYKNLHSKVEMFRENIIMNENILNISYKYNIKNGIFCCSTCIFPFQPPSYPMTEDMILKGEPHPSNASYGWAKRLLYFQIQNYNSQYGTKYICLSPCNLYGKYDNFNLENSHVVAALIHKFYLASLKNEHLEIKTSLESKRQFISAKDLSKIIIRTIEKFHTIHYDNIIITDKDFLITELVHIISNIFHYKNFSIIEDEKGQVKKTCSDIRMREVFPDIQLSSLENELNEIVPWFIKNYNTIVRK